jgi:Protein of unknown function (DUF3592)
LNVRQMKESAIAFCISGLFATTSVVRYLVRAAEVKRWCRTEADVVRVIPAEGSSVKPVLRFVPAGKKEDVVFVSGFHVAKCQVGEKVSIVFDPKNPQKVSIAGWGCIHFFSIWLAGVAAVTLFGGLIAGHTK